jgi:hypothetical protein
MSFPAPMDTRARQRSILRSRATNRIANARRPKLNCAKTQQPFLEYNELELKLHACISSWRQIICVAAGHICADALLLVRADQIMLKPVLAVQENNGSSTPYPRKDILSPRTDFFFKAVFIDQLITRMSMWNETVRAQIKVWIIGQLVLVLLTITQTCYLN